MSKADPSLDGYITLKEAAKISGYSADYIGQLIRKGKISGRQIYTNIAWVTTEEALKDYLEKEGRKRNDGSNQLESGDSPESFEDEIDSAQRSLLVTEGMIRWLLYVALLIGAISLLALFYMLSIALDHRISRMQFQSKVETVHLVANASTRHGEH